MKNRIVSIGLSVCLFFSYAGVNRGQKRNLDLFDWLGTVDQDIDQSPGALLPVRAGGHVSDANKSPQ